MSRPIIPANKDSIFMWEYKVSYIEQFYCIILLTMIFFTKDINEFKGRSVVGRGGMSSAAI